MPFGPFGLVLATILAAPFGSTTIEREFRYAPDRVEMRIEGGMARVSAEGAAAETEPGRPDLPWLSERIELPDGMRAVALEVAGVETELLAASVRIPAALAARAEAGAPSRTAPDPEHFGASFEPRSQAALGLQGWERGRNILTLRVAPTRWNPVSGRLERVTRLRIRVTLAPGLERPVERQRVIPEWEAGGGAAAFPKGGAGPLAQSGGGSEPELFAPTQLPSVLGSPVAYVIVTDDAMASEFQRLADWKTQTGVPAVVRTLSSIRSNYPYGSDDAERIRMFLRDAYTRWGARWVLLGGDTQVIPVRFARTAFYGGEWIPSDLYYSCLDGNWNGDGDGIFGEAYVDANTPGDACDLMPELWVGRAPVTTVAQAELFVDKSIEYVRAPSGDYEDRLLAFAEVLFPQHWTPSDSVSLDGAVFIEDILPFLATHPTSRIVRLYQNHLDPDYVPGALPESRAAVIDSLNRGYNIAVHVGHGFRNVMSVGDANLGNTDAMGLVNTGRPFHLYANNCTSNAIDYPCIGEAFLLAPNGGAVTNIGSTRLDFPTAGRFYQREYFRLLYMDSVNAVGEAQARQKLPFIASSSVDGVHRWTQLTMLLLGDPELRIYTARPRVLTVTHPPTFALADTQIAVHVTVGGTPLAGARVTVLAVDDEYRSAVTNGTGDVILPFRPDGAGSLTLTVTGYDCRPYQAVVPIVASALPTLADLAPQFDDDASNGTAGNSNGVLDAGETVDVLIQVRNAGSASASSLTGTLSTSDAYAVIQQPSVAYGSLGVGQTTAVSVGYRVVVPANTPDQHLIPCTLLLKDGANRRWTETVELLVRAPELVHVGHLIQDQGGNGVADPGETSTFRFRIRNMGTGVARSVSAKLRRLDALSSVSDSTAAFGDLAPGQEVEGDAIVVTPNSTAANLEFRMSDLYGLKNAHRVDLLLPATPVGLAGKGAASSIELSWTRVADSDLWGYNVYRSSAPGGPFSKLNPVPTGRTAYYLDAGLPPLTRYYYQVTAVDSSGNESPAGATANMSTNPPLHAIFPISMGRPSSGIFPIAVAVDHVWPGYPYDIVAGSDYLYAWHPDGTAPVDADGGGATSGDFTRRGINYTAAPTLADLDNDGVKEIIGASWDSTRVYVFDRDGQVKPGWPAVMGDAVWSGVAAGDIDGDGMKELVSGSFGYNLYAFKHNGQEVRDGDANPATFGVFKRLDTPYNLGTPALANIDGTGGLEIVFGTENGNIHVFKADGSQVTGWPRFVGGLIHGSLAVGGLDGAGDAQLEIVLAVEYPSSTSDSLFVFLANGQRRVGWPKPVKVRHYDQPPSPALADMNGDSKLDVVITGTDGLMYVFDRNGAALAPLSGVRYSALTANATTSSPVIADINGDGLLDVVIGDDAGRLTAIGGNGALLAGFPIVLPAEVKGVPAVCDCDFDGKTEIVLGGWDQNLYVWDYDFPFSPNGQPPWPQFHHDAARTGFAGSPVFTDTQPPAQAPPAGLELGRPLPNPAGVSMRIAFGVPADRAGEALEVAVYDLAGRKVRVLEHGAARAGRHVATWDGRADQGGLAANGVYFVRLALGREQQSRKLIVLR